MLVLFQGNTFQLILASTKSSSYAILLYPEDGLKFAHTSVGSRKKILEGGFNQGMVESWFWSTEQGTYYRITTDEDTSIWDLTKYDDSDVTGRHCVRRKWVFAWKIKTQ